MTAGVHCGLEKMSSDGRPYRTAYGGFSLAHLTLESRQDPRALSRIDCYCRLTGHGEPGGYHSPYRYTGLHSPGYPRCVLRSRQSVSAGRKFGWNFTGPSSRERTRVSAARLLVAHRIADSQRHAACARKIYLLFKGRFGQPVKLLHCRFISDYDHTDAISGSIQPASLRLDRHSDSTGLGRIPDSAAASRIIEVIQAGMN